MVWKTHVEFGPLEMVGCLDCTEPYGMMNPSSESNLVISIFETSLDAFVFTLTSLPAALANGFNYGIKDLSGNYHSRGPFIPENERFRTWGYSFKDGFQPEMPRFNSSGRISQHDGARLMKGVTTIIVPPFISPLPYSVKIPTSAIYGSGIPYHLNNY